MKGDITTIPGYQVCDYLLVLRPNDELWNRVMKIKEEYSDKFKNEHGRWSRPHIVLASFQQYEMMEERLLSRLQTIAMGFPPFKVELKDYGNFPSHTIYINISSRVGVQNLVKKIRSEGQRLMKMEEGNKPLYMLEPHITIATKLLPWQYEKGWLEYSHKYFTGRFIADSMYLLKRKAMDSKFHVSEKFTFQNLPVTIKQGELFS